MPSRPVILKDGVMYQHDFNGNIIFQHRNGPKWNYHSDNPKLLGFRLQDECFELIRQLREKWDGVIGRDFSDKPEKLKKMVEQLASQTYIYKRVGYDQRSMIFLSNGKIGTGKAGCEQLWDVHEVDGKLRLEISSENAKTCVLALDEDKIWRGRWLAYEQMPVELAPVNSE